MGNKDNRISIVTDTIHLFVQFFTSFLRKSSCRLIDNDDLRIKICSFYDLNQFTVFEIIIINHISCFDLIKSIGL